jgi:hypothetical protein
VRTCPNCRFLIPEGTAECTFCRGDARTPLVASPTVATATPARGRRTSGRPSRRARPAASRTARLRRRTADAIARNRAHVVLSVAALVAVVATTLLVAPDRVADGNRTGTDIPSGDALTWTTFVPPDGGLRIELPGSPVTNTSENGTQHRLDLGPLVLVVGSVSLGTDVPEPLAYLRTVAVRTATSLQASVAERGAEELPWGPSLDVRLDTKGSAVLLRLTLAGNRLFVIEGDLAPTLADRADSEALATYERVVASFSPAG